MDFTPFVWEQEKVHAPSGMHYQIRIADHVFLNESGEPDCTMFGYTYTRIPVSAGRPVLFAYNGGPGADSSWVHLGFLGPKIVELPDYLQMEIPAKAELTDNDNFLLDVCDIVCMNPVGTTYTIAGGERKKYYDISGDADSFVDYITSWLKENHRENSPVFLAGESYGTLRNLVVTKRMPEWVQLKGVIYIGVSWNVGAKGAGSMYVEPNVRRLGADAAATWFHFHQGEMDKQAFIDEAIEFAYSDYAHALLVGNRLSQDERRVVARKLHRYTNLDEELLLRQNLRFSEQDFLQQMYPDGVISTYDSRITLRRSQMTSDGTKEDDFSNEPFMAKAGSAVDQLMKQYEQELQLPGDRKKADMMELAYGWSYRTIEEDTLTLPQTLMEERPDLKMMLANGYYDMQSTFDFVLYYLSQHDLPKDRTRVCFYDAGHAVYIGGLAKQFMDDVRDFIKNS